ncbi:MAG TPA: glycosyltransferase [Leptolyngbyaceae cyanobacterium]
MKQVRETLDMHLPSFSIVLETENLANADLKGLSKSLASLANQDLSLTNANEVLLLDSGDTPPDLLNCLCQQYPWIKVHQIQLSAGYYQAKMLGAQIATGEIVVYSDSDCIYQSNWLRNILTPFTQSDDIKIVAGETRTRGKGPYGTAMALTYIFPQYSGEEGLVKTSQYFLNNVAFQRDFLLRQPIPAELPLYRGNCVIHACNLLHQGYTIWQQPQAKATHAPPNGLSHFFWRFLLMGHDYYWQKYLLAKANNFSVNPASFPTKYKSISANSFHKKLPDEFMFGLKGKIKIFFERFQGMLAENPLNLIYLPLAVPIVIAAMTLIAIGYIITLFKPHYLLKVYEEILGEA